MWTRFLLLIGIATGMRAQQYDPMDLLRRVQARIARSLERLPRYMCTETIDRTVENPDIHDLRTACDQGPARRATHLATSDRLRLDVGIASNVEMYSWVGESRFDDRDLLDIVREGAISTGSFAAFLVAIFRAGYARFTYNGETTENGRKVAEFGYSVSHDDSHYLYGNPGHQVVTGYSGTFLVDPSISDLVQLVVRTSQLPRETLACYASTTLEYMRVHFGESDFLLPKESRLRIYQTDGGESENRTVFSNCHEFLGDSTISFSPPNSSPGDASHGSVSPALTIPPGLRFRVALSQGIDTSTAAAGDPIKARLIEPIKNHSKVLAPARTPVTARIVRIRQYYSGGATAIALDIKLETVEIAGVRVQLAAAPDTGKAFQKSKTGTLQRSIDLGTLRNLEDRSASYVFRNVQPHYLIGSGLESGWVTGTP